MKGSAYLIISAAILLAVLFLNSSAYAYWQPTKPILLKSKVIEPQANQISSQAHETETYTGYYILQLDYMPDEEDKAYLKEKGIGLLSYIPENSWFARADNADIESIAGVSYFGKVKPEHKLSPHLGALSSVTIILFSDDVQTKNAISERARITSSYGNALDAEINSGDLDFFAAMEKVKWIEPRNFLPQAFNDNTRAASSAEALNGTSYNLLGTNVTVAVWDEGYGNHSDYNSRRTIGDIGEGSFSQHSAHVTGTLLGSGNLSSSAGGTANQWRGVAPNATLMSYEWWNNVAELVTEYNSSINTYNATVSQNSWGLGTTVSASNCLSLLGSYNSDSQYLDNITRGYLGNPMTLVWAAGNQRSTDEIYCGSLGFTYNTTTPYGTSKNVITVGAVNKTGSIASFTSWGPTDDGRLKPDVVAVGVSVKSTNLSDTYEVLSGTSMAAPVVSGIAALIYQDYRQIFANNPLPSTVKALLLHTAIDMNNTGPDYHTGYGLVNATEAIRTLREDNYTNTIIEGNVTQGTNNTYNIRINGRSTLKITLVWNDYPADPAAAAALVNDLDMLVYNSTGSRFYPWTLNNTNPAGGAVQTAKDSINNVEQVYVSNPSNGTWTIAVNGSSVPNGPQNYSIISSVSFDVTPPQINFASPTPVNNSNISASWVYVNASSNEQLSNATLEWNNGTLTNYSMGGAGTSFFFNVTNLLNGTYSYKVFVNDTANNTNVSDARYVTVDTIFPALNVQSPLNQTYNTTPALNYTIGDAFGSISACWYVNSTGSSIALQSCLNASSFNVSEGFSNITIYVNDSAGNTNYSSVNFTIISSAPSLSMSSPANATYNATVLSLNYTASGSVCWLFNVTGDRINLTGCANATFNATPNSQNNITLYVNDTANNTNSIQRFFVVDAVIPNITLLSPLNQTYNSTPSLNFTVFDAGSIDRCWYINSTGSSIGIAGCLNASSLNVSEGFNNITIYINDTGGNSNSSSVNFTIDFIPSVSLVMPQNRTYNTTTISLNFTASDSIGLDKCWIINVTGGLQNITGCLNATINATADRQNNITLTANDTRGNSNSSSIFFTVDTIPPSITFFSPSPNNQMLNNSKTLLINATISENATAVLEFSSANLTMNNSFGYVWERNVTIPSAGNYTFKVWANDTANNTNVSETRWVKVSDTVKPSLNVSSPAAAYATSTIPVNYTADDNIALDKCWYKLNSNSNITISGCTNTTVTAAEGSNTIIIGVNDTDNNRNETNITFTYTAPTATPTPTSAPGGSGPGSSSSTPTPTRTPTPAATATPLPKKELTINNITAGGTAEIASEELKAINLRKIEITAKNAVNNIKIETTKVEEKPAEVTVPPGKVYHYIKIDKVNITDADVSSAKLEFQVEKSWITGNNIDESTVKLNRFSNNAWVTLTTTKTGEDATYAFYQAASPGLSVFSITAEEKATPTPTAALQSTPTPQPKTEGSDLFLILFVVLSLAAIAGGMYYFYYLKKIPKDIIIIAEKKFESGESLESIRSYLLAMGYSRNTVEKILKRAVDKAMKS